MNAFFDNYGIKLFDKFLISEEKSAIIKRLQNLINLNYEELTSMDTPQYEMIVEEELGQDYNREDEDIAFIEDNSGSNSDNGIYCIHHSY